MASEMEKLDQILAAVATLRSELTDFRRHTDGRLDRLEAVVDGISERLLAPGETPRVTQKPKTDHTVAAR